MKVNVIATYTVNNGEPKRVPLTIEMPDGFTNTPTERFALMSKAADMLTDEGQIMLSGVSIQDEAVAA